MCTGGQSGQQPRSLPGPPLSSPFHPQERGEFSELHCGRGEPCRPSGRSPFSQLTQSPATLVTDGHSLRSCGQRPASSARRGHPGQRPCLLATTGDLTLLPGRLREPEAGASFLNHELHCFVLLPDRKRRQEPAHLQMQLNKTEPVISSRHLTRNWTHSPEA